MENKKLVQKIDDNDVYEVIKIIPAEYWHSTEYRLKSIKTKKYKTCPASDCKLLTDEEKRKFIALSKLN